MERILGIPSLIELDEKYKKEEWKCKYEMGITIVCDDDEYNKL